MLTNVIGDRVAQQECEPAATLALRADFTAADEIALRDDADQLAGSIDHGKPADMMPQHGFGGLQNGGIRRDRYDGAGHDLMGAHVTIPCSMSSRNGRSLWRAQRCRR